MKVPRLVASTLVVAFGIGAVVHHAVPGRDSAPESKSERDAHSLILGPTYVVNLDDDAPPYQLANNRITYPKDSRFRGYTDTVVTVDLTSKKAQTIARASFTKGFINWAVSAGDWTVFVDQSKQQSDGGALVLWRVRAINRVTHEARILASNGAMPDALVPRVYSSDGYVYWSSAERDKSVRESLWRPEWATPRDILRHADLAPTSESINSGWLYYLGAPRARTDDRLASDCWRVPLDGGDPEPMTNSGLVMTCVADDNWLAWTNHIDPDTEDVPDDGVMDDPYELWAMKVGGTARLINRGYVSPSHPIVVGDFLVWQNAEAALTVTSLQDPSASKVLPGETPVQTALRDGNAVALLSSSDGHDVATIIDLRDIKLVH